MRLYLILIAWMLLLGPLTAQQEPWRTKIDPAILRSLNQHETTGYFILLKETAALSDARFLRDKSAKGEYVFQQLSTTAATSQAPLLELLRHKGLPYRSFRIINAIYTESNLAVVEEIAAHPAAGELIYNFSAALEKPVLEESADSRSPEELTWGILRIKADSVWMMGYQGQGVVIAGHDTGIDWQHPAIQSKYRGWNNGVVDHNYNWHDAIHTPSDPNDTNPCGFDLQIPCDDNSHGTHTVGTMVGQDGSNQIGVAPAAQWIGVRNMDEGNGTLFSYIEGFEWFVAPTNSGGLNPDPSRAPDVINNSWYCSTGEGCNETNFDVLREVVDNVRAAGIVVVVSAGNAGPGCNSVTGPPGFFESSFSVGATTDQDTIANYSSRGAVTIDGSLRLKPNVSAPGSGVNSCIPNGGYGLKSGTSMAAPHVAGVVALMLSARPELKGHVEDIETILEQTADYLYTDQACNDLTGNDIPNYTYGYGRINALSAVKAALEWELATSETVPGNAQQTVRIYPNPFSNVIQMDMAGITGDALLTILDVSGRIVQQHKMVLTPADNRIFSMKDIPAGVYFYQLSSNTGSWSGKIIKTEDR